MMTMKSAPEDGAPRVLVEHTDGSVRWAVDGVLAARGCEVTGCGGPASFPKARCPLLTTGECPLAEDADVVVHALNLNDATNASVLAALKARYPTTPIIVEIPVPEIERHAELLAGCRTIGMPMTGPRLGHAVTDALADPDAPGLDAY